MIDAECRETENNRPAKFYRLTPRGRKQLQHEAREWDRRSTAIVRLLEA